MFGKLKNKLKEWTNKVSEVDETEEEALEQPEEAEEVEESEEDKKGFLKKLFSKKEEEKDKEESEETEEVEEIKEERLEKKEKKKTTKKKAKETQKKSKEETIKTTPKETDKVDAIDTSEPKEKKGFFKKLISSKKTITEEEFDEYSEDLEMILLENNVALEVSDKILEKLKDSIVGKELSKKEIQETIEITLKEIIESVLLEPFDILDEIKNKDEPYIMIFCGINGVGKTTSIAKFAHMLKEKGLTSVLAAGDTFRAAAVEQLKVHGDKLNIKVIAHDYGSDPAAVGFDAVKYAKKNNIDVVLIDTAGRIHTATNLLQEMAKIKRVCKPDRTIFLGESITGNDAVDQVKAFNEHIGIDGIILSKADIDEKGGTALSVGYVTEKPILFLGTGQEYGDIEPFDKKKFIEKLGL